MNHYILELALWMLAIFLLGCVIGATCAEAVRQRSTANACNCAGRTCEAGRNPARRGCRNCRRSA